MITVSLVWTAATSMLCTRTSLVLQPWYASAPVILLCSHSSVYSSLIHLEKDPLLHPSPFLSCCSFAKSCLTLRPHWLQHARLLYSLLSPRVSSTSHLLSRSCYLTISSSATPFSSCLQPSPALVSFLMNWLFISGGQSTGASATVLPELPTCGYVRFCCGAQIPPVLLKGVGVRQVIRVPWRGDGKSHSDQKCSGAI